ncbi:hypothetical protein WJX77_005892 [Trebouxia sp. C0004]
MQITSIPNSRETDRVVRCTVALALFCVAAAVLGLSADPLSRSSLQLRLKQLVQETKAGGNFTVHSQLRPSYGTVEVTGLCTQLQATRTLCSYQYNTVFVGFAAQKQKVADKLSFSWPQLTTEDCAAMLSDSKGIRKMHARQEFLYDPSLNISGSRAIHGWLAIGVPSNSDDCMGHGTHVSGTIGGLTYGVAKKAAVSWMARAITKRFHIIPCVGGCSEAAGLPGQRTYLQRDC